MNNTRTRAIVAVVLTAATLVVGLTIAATMTTPAFAGGKQGNGNGNGNTVTILKCKNKGSASGFDTTTNQECENLICTHPGSDGTCVTENEGATVSPVGNQTNGGEDNNGGD